MVSAREPPVIVPFSTRHHLASPSHCSRVLPSNSETTAATADSGKLRTKKRRGKRIIIGARRKPEACRELGEYHPLFTESMRLRLCRASGCWKTERVACNVFRR